MPPKKFAWGDVPNSEFVKKKDEENGTWIECGLCHVVIKVRATFAFTEWVNHCSSKKHCQLVTDRLCSQGTRQLTSYFVINKDETESSISPKPPPSKKSKLINPCPGFFYGKNPELLQLYNTYKKNDYVNDSTDIHCKNGVWSIHSSQCTNEAVTTRRCKRSDKRACQQCFDFKYRLVVKDRVKRMDRIYHIEKHITEPSASKTGYFEVSNFLRSNVANASPTSLVLRERCAKYISHQDWIDKNKSVLRTYDAIDKNGKVHH